MNDVNDPAIPCPLCGGLANRDVYARDGLRVVQCRRCRLVFQPELDQAEIDAYYRERPTAVTLRWTGQVARRLRDVTAAIQTRYPGGRLLDVGCGNGEWLHDLSVGGLTCVGLEPNREQAAFAREQGLDVRAAALAPGLFPEASFDAVTFIQVLEHLQDPVAAVRQAGAYLRPGGMLVIDVPSYNNPRFLVYRLTRLARVVSGDFIRPHLFYYTPRTLRAIVEKAGLTVEHVACGRYDIKFGPHPALRLIDAVAQRAQIGGITLYAHRPGADGGRG